MDEEHFDELSIDDLADKYLKDQTEEADEDDDEGSEADAQEEPEDDQSEDDADADADEEESEEEEDEGDDDVDEEEGGDKPARKAKVAEDDAEVTVQINGKDQKFKVADLKRLAGQEASLTQKSQSVSSQMKAVEAQGLYIAKILDQRLEKARTQAAKYANVDLFKAQRELDPEDFDAVRAAKQAAEIELNTVTRESQEFIKSAQATRQAVLRERGKAALATITKAIPDWNDEVYGRVRSYAISNGMRPDDVNEIVDPGAIIMIHKAMQYDSVKSKTEEVKKKVSKAPKKVMRKSSKTTDATGAAFRAKKNTAMKSGDIDDVAALYLAAQKNQA